jgi:Asp-tRNA(Asn)/Glu-tRNA(Gln) amidotransferase A subunit family amidase
MLPAQSPPPDIVYEASITELQAAMSAGRATSVGLVNAYIARINAYDKKGAPALNAIIRLNSKARADAAALDAERRAGRVRGPLHGIPILLKDNYGTRDMTTTAGSIALAGMQTPDDAFTVRKLREAGAVILGKTNMHELAAGITNISSIGGQTCNPYDPSRAPGGSSGGSGAAVAASFAAIAWGSDTCGSIRIPAAVHNLVGLRPTKGLTSVAGVVPLSHTQDVTGPIARSVMDLAIGLDATIGADSADPATGILQGRAVPGFVASLDSTALRGKRFGVLTAHFGNEADDAEGTRVVRAALEKLKARGAEVVDIAIAPLDTLINRAGVIPYELKPDLQDYLATIPNAPVKSLTEIVEAGMMHTLLDGTLRTREASGTRDSPAYREALARRTVARDMVVAFMDSAKLDAIVYPTVRRKATLIGEPQRGGNCQLSAVTGLPALSIPAGFTPDGMPIGMELLGRPLADAGLVAMAYDYEVSARPRVAPGTTPRLVAGRAPPPVRMSASATRGATVLSGEFSFDPTKRELSYTVNVRGSGVVPVTVYAISLDRDSAGTKGVMRLRMSGEGVSSLTGAVTLGFVERGELLAGRLALVAYTKDDPRGALRAVIKPRVR